MSDSPRIYIGCHLSVTDGYEAMGKTMLSFGGNTFAFFTRNPRGGKSKELSQTDAAALRELLCREGFGPLVAHGSYTMNLCSASEQTRENALDMLQKDLERMELLPGNYYNFHPGSHTGQGTEAGIAQIAQALSVPLASLLNGCVLDETFASQPDDSALSLGKAIARIASGCSPRARRLMLTLCQAVAANEKLPEHE